MKLTNERFDFRLSNEQVDVLRKTSPGLLNQAQEYGHEVDGNKILFINQPGPVKANIIIALSKARTG
jgi:hypothetical protein